jgi:hypothetical protein
MTYTTSEPNVYGPDGPGPGGWVGYAPDGSVITAPYLNGAPPGPVGVPSATTAGLGRRRARAVVFGAAVPVAVLAAIAPFLQVWRYTYNDGLFGAQTVVNGWGSVSAHPASFATSHSHDTNYGLPMALAAAFLLAGAVAFAITRRAAVAALPISVGATLAGGTALLLTLDRGGRDSASTGSDSWAAGPGFWLIVVAGALGVLVMVAGAALAAVDARADTGTPAHPGGSTANPAWFPPNDAAHYAPADPHSFGPTEPSGYAPTGQARFTPPWAP